MVAGGRIDAVKYQAELSHRFARRQQLLLRRRVPETLFQHGRRLTSFSDEAVLITEMTVQSYISCHLLSI